MAIRCHLCHCARWSRNPWVGFSYFGELGKSATFKAKKQPAQAAWGARRGSPCSLTEGPGAIRRLRPLVVRRPPRAPRPRCAPTPPSGGSPAHLAVIGQSGPCLVPTGQRPCPFLGRARPSRPRIPARPRGHLPPPQPSPPRSAPPPAQCPSPLGAWERCCLPGAPG